MPSLGIPLRLGSPTEPGRGRGRPGRWPVSLALPCTLHPPPRWRRGGPICGRGRGPPAFFSAHAPQLCLFYARVLAERCLIGHLGLGALAPHHLAWLCAVAAQLKPAAVRADEADSSRRRQALRGNFGWACHHSECIQVASGPTGFASGYAALPREHLYLGAAAGGRPCCRGLGLHIQSTHWRRPAVKAQHIIEPCGARLVQGRRVSPPGLVCGRAPVHLESCAGPRGRLVCLPPRHWKDAPREAARWLLVLVGLLETEFPWPKEIKLAKAAFVSKPTTSWQDPHILPQLEDPPLLL